MKLKLLSIAAGAAIGFATGGPRNAVRGAMFAKRLHDHVLGDSDVGADALASRVIDGHVDRK